LLASVYRLTITVATLGLIAPEAESTTTGGGRVDGALDMAAMDALVIQKKRKRTMDAVVWAVGGGVIR
jgi:hypothetical protein